MNLLEIRKIMEQEGIIFSFTGLISQKMLVGIVETVKKELLELGAKNSVVNAIFSIAIEQMQNIMSYSSDKKIIDSSIYASQGICAIGLDKHNNKYFVASSNKINKNDKTKIKEKIDKVNSLNYNELRKYLRDLLKSGRDSHSRGAGVGFVEMAKRSSENIEYNFTHFEDNEYLEIKVFI